MHDSSSFSELAGYRVGDLVRLPCIDSPLVVVDLDPPSMLVLRSPSGTTLKARWRVVTRDTATMPRINHTFKP